MHEAITNVKESLLSIFVARSEIHEPAWVGRDILFPFQLFDPECNVDQYGRDKQLQNRTKKGKYYFFLKVSRIISIIPYYTVLYRISELFDF